MHKTVKRLAAWIIALLLCMNSAFALGFDSLLFMADTYCQAGDMERALACVELAGRLEPEDEKVDLTAAGIYLAMNDTQSALQAVDSALEKNPVSPEGWLMRCRCDLLLEDLPSLEKDLPSASFMPNPCRARRRFPGLSRPALRP